MAQLRDPWCERMIRMLQWVTSVKGPGGLVSFGLTPGDVTSLKRESESFELAPDGLLLRSRAEAGNLPAGAARAVAVLPCTVAFPAGLAPGGAPDPSWTWRRWALWHAHQGLLGGHIPYEKALPRVQSWAWWKGMSTDLARYCHACRGCLAVRGRPAALPGRSEHSRVPFDVVQVDLQGPLVPPSVEGWSFVLTTICVYTRFVHLKGLRTKTRQEVARALLTCFW